MNFFSYFYNFFNDITALSVASLSLWHVCNSLIQDQVEENEGFRLHDRVERMEKELKNEIEEV